MKTTTLFLVLSLFCLSFSVQSQTEPSLDSLLDRLSENHMGSVTEVFTNEELEILKNYFYDGISINENSSILLNRRISTTQSVSVVTAADINPVDLSSIEEFLPSPLNEFEGAGIVRANPANGVVIIDNINQVWIRGIGTGQYSKQGTISNVPINESITGIEVLSGPQGELYGISTNGVDSSTLLHINTTTWEAMPIGNPNIVLPINLGRDANDNLYTVGIDGDKFFRISISTGMETEIGDIGYDANFGQGMTYDAYNDKLFLTAFNNDLFDSELREVNINTGYSTSLGTISPGILMQFGWGSMYDRDDLGLDNNNLNDFSFYPNPVNDQITLNSSTIINTVEIYSVLGQKLITNRMNASSSTLNISQLTTGTYILKVITNKETDSYKLIKN